MRLNIFLVALAAAMIATSADAADDLRFSPQPAWVVPTPLPPVEPAGQAPIQLLLADQQIRLGRDGSTSFGRSVIRIDSSQGLAAGNITIAWRPDFDTVTIHRVDIVRGDERIDVLASGQTFTVARREANLESATLDGMLTATLQPEGLRVGDIIDFALTVESNDPTLRGHVEQVAAGWNMIPLGRGRVSVEWPSDLALRTRIVGLPDAKPSRRGDVRRLELQADDLQPIQVPKGAPARFAIGRRLEISSAASWSDIGALFAPLYDRAAAIPPSGPLRDEVERIRGASADPLTRALAALALVQDRVRYVALLMGEGNLVPASAEATWSRRFGDCKAKTALLLGMLGELGIAADAVAVSIGAGDGLDAALPMAGLFNHVLVRARIDGRDHWLDGTRTGDKQPSDLAVPNFGWGLELVSKDAALVPMIAPPLEVPSNEMIIHFDSSDGLKFPARAKLEAIYRDESAQALNATVSMVGEAARDEMLRAFWKSQYSFIEPKSVAADYNPDRNELRLTMEGEARLDWSDNSYEIDAYLGYKPDFGRPSGPMQDAPIAVRHPAFSRTAQTIVLPPGFANRSTQAIPDVRETLAGVEYRRTAGFTGDRFEIEVTQRSLVPEVGYDRAKADEARLRELSSDALHLEIPAGYRPGPDELKAALDLSLDDPRDLETRGLMMLDVAAFDAAIADFDRILKAKPDYAWALAHRGISRVWKQDFDAAERDLDAAEAIDPGNSVVMRARGLMAAFGGDSQAAIEHFSEAIEVDAKDSFSLGHRAKAYAALRRYDLALADATAALEFKPNWTELRLIRANAYSNQGDSARAVAEADTLMQGETGNAYDLITAAAIYVRFGKTTEADAAYERALAIAPVAMVYLNRAQNRPKSDYSGRLKDLEAALALEPDNVDVLGQRARLHLDRGEYDEALDLYSRALRTVPRDRPLLVARAVAFHRSGKLDRARQDFAAALAQEPTAVDYNSVCWSKATAGILLESALEDCNNALRLAPDRPAYLDSRGFVFLRLNRLEDALNDYGRALAREQFAASLMGRAITHMRMGRHELAERDRQAAVALNARVQEQFADYGLPYATE